MRQGLLAKNESGRGLPHVKAQAELLNRVAERELPDKVAVAQAPGKQSCRTELLR